jgi:hypothetical protein
MNHTQIQDLNKQLQNSAESLKTIGWTHEQKQAFVNICYRYNIESLESLQAIADTFLTVSHGGLPEGYISGSIAGKIYVGISPEGRVSS